MQDNDDAQLLELDTDDTNDASRTPAKYPRYVFLVRMSQRLGGVATRSFVEVRDFLHKEITVTPPSVSDRFLSGMPRIRLQASGAKPDDENSKVVVGSKDSLTDIVKRSGEILARANTVFPLTLFPDTVVVDRTKITITRRDLLWSSDSISFRIEDVLNVSVTLGPLFGSLTLASRVMSTTDHFRIDHLWRSDAIRLKHIIQGYMIAQHNGINVASLPHDELVATLMELGHDQA